METVTGMAVPLGRGCWSEILGRLGTKRRFDEMVALLARESRDLPESNRFRVALPALVGFDALLLALLPRALRSRCRHSLDGGKMVQVLALLDWPRHVFICTVNGNRPMADKHGKASSSEVFAAPWTDDRCFGCSPR